MTNWGTVHPVKTSLMLSKWIPLFNPTEMRKWRGPLNQGAKIKIFEEKFCEEMVPTKMTEMRNKYVHKINTWRSSAATLAMKFHNYEEIAMKALSFESSINEITYEKFRTFLKKRLRSFCWVCTSAKVKSIN